MRYTYRVYYYGEPISHDCCSILIRAKSVAEAKRKFKKKYPDRKVMYVS